MEETQSQNFLGTAKLGKLMLKFCVPCILSLLVSALYNIVDQIFVGNSELSVLGNAATGVVFPIFIIAQAFAWWFGDGCAAYLNICQGKGEADKSHRAVGTGIVLTVLASAVLMAVFYPLKRPLLLTFGASADVTTASGEFIPGSIDYAVRYFNIISSFITQVTIVVISLVCNIMLKKYGALSPYGENIPIALIGIESKVFTVVVNIVVGIVLGCQPIIGYNMGACNYSRVKRLYLYILSSTVAVGLVFTILFEACPSAVVGIFGNPDPAQVDPEKYWEFGKKLFRIFLMLVAFTCVVKMTSIFFQALGKPVFAVIASLVRDVICFLPLVCALPVAMGIDGILWAAPIADAAAMIVTVALTVACFKELGKKEKLQILPKP